DTLTNQGHSYLLQMDDNGNITGGNLFLAPIYVNCIRSALVQINPLPSDGFMILATNNIVKIDSSGFGCFFFPPADTITPNVISFTVDSVPLSFSTLVVNWYSPNRNHF